MKRDTNDKSDRTGPVELSEFDLLRILGAGIVSGSLGKNKETRAGSDEPGPCAPNRDDARPA